MNFSLLTRTHKRILEINSILNDDARSASMGQGVTRSVHLELIEKANQPLLAELKMLERKQKFVRDNLTIAIAIVGALISFVGILVN